MAQKLYRGSSASITTRKREHGRSSVEQKREFSVDPTSRRAIVDPKQQRTCCASELSLLKVGFFSDAEKKSRSSFCVSLAFGWEPVQGNFDSSLSPLQLWPVPSSPVCGDEWAVYEDVSADWILGALRQLGIGIFYACFVCCREFCLFTFLPSLFIQPHFFLNSLRAQRVTWVMNR